MADEPKLAYRYKGPDKFAGIPARDLTVEDFEALPVLRQLDVKANASYEAVDIDDGAPTQPYTTAELQKMTREELNSYAGLAGVTTDAEDFANKADLIAAIEEAQKGQEEGA